MMRLMGKELALQYKSCTVSDFNACVTFLRKKNTTDLLCSPVGEGVPVSKMFYSAAVDGCRKKKKPNPGGEHIS